jgi:hypothetical protein
MVDDDPINESLIHSSDLSGVRRFLSKQDDVIYCYNDDDCNFGPYWCCAFYYGYPN